MPDQPTITSSNVPKPPAISPKAPSQSPASAGAAVVPSATAPATSGAVASSSPVNEMGGTAILADATAPNAVPIPESKIRAKPLGLPQFDKIKSKNPNLSFRWVNRSVGLGSGSSSTMRYEQSVAQGFIPATPTDCEVPGLAARDGHFVNGDVILMKIARTDYIGALKYNHDMAEYKAGLHRRGATTQAAAGESLGASRSEAPLIPTPPSLRGKISTIVPTEEQAAGLCQSDDEKLAEILSGKPAST